MENQITIFSHFVVSFSSSKQTGRDQTGNGELDMYLKKGRRECGIITNLLLSLQNDNPCLMDLSWVNEPILTKFALWYQLVIKIIRKNKDQKGFFFLKAKLVFVLSERREKREQAGGELKTHLFYGIFTISFIMNNQRSKF